MKSIAYAAAAPETIPGGKRARRKAIHSRSESPLAFVTQGKRMRMVAVMAIALMVPVALAQAPPAYRNPALPPAQRAADLVGRMTLEEKALQSVNTAPAIPRLGVPAYDYWSEGLHGIARSGYSTLFPQAIGMASTWDAPLLNRIGTVVSTEARAKFNQAVRHNIHSIYFGLTIWSPNINIFRDPRWGRGQETYGEDPYLTATLGEQFVRGIQGADPNYYRAIATPKHFAVHSGPESERHRFNVDPSPHDLWETYLPAFRRTIVDAKADSIMCAYNAIDGKPACASDLLLKTILRGDWHFRGFVTSDCGAIDDIYQKSAHHYSPNAESAAATALLAGTDTNCGATYKVLPAAVGQGLLTESELDQSLERLFEARIRLGLFDPPEMVAYSRLPYSVVRSAAHLGLSLKTSEESMVLLKNDGILPLAAAKYRRIAVVGPNAASLAALEGNYNAVPRDPQMPVDSLKAALPNATIAYAQGAPYVDGFPLPVSRTLLHPAAGSPEDGLKGEYFKGSAFQGAPVASRLDHEIDFDWNSAGPVAGVQQDDFSVRWTGVIVPIGPGKMQFSMRLAHCYPCNDLEHYVVKIDGATVADFATDGKEHRSNSTPPFQADFADTQPHTIEIDYSHRAPLFGGGITFQWAPPAALLQRKASRTIAEADLVIAMVGLSPELEGEEMPVHVEGFSGGDRTDIKLPDAQQALLDEAAKAGKPLVIVLLNGSALAVDWAQEHANAVLEAWYPGEFGGKAIAATLLGGNNPSGRLPVTFYRSPEQLPPFEDYSMKGRTYRYYTGEPLYAFGYGLSYTKFAYSGIALPATLHAGQPLAASVKVKNTGTRAGDEVVEAYLLPPAGGNGGLSPRLQLAGFQRIHLAPGEQRKVQFTFDPRSISEVDGEGVRSVEAGTYRLSIGGSQPNDPNAPSQPQTITFRIEGNQVLPR